jgi:branched-chain amino acid transport system permease protein
LWHDRFTSTILAAAALQALFAVSWVLLIASGQPSLGHALPYGAGAYAAVLIARGIPVESINAAGMMPVLLTTIAALAGACIGGLQGRLTRLLSAPFLAAVTLATVEAAHGLATMWTAPVLRGANEGDTAILLAQFPAGARAQAWLAAAAMAAGVLCVAAAMRTRAGVALQAAAGDDRGAAALGFNGPRVRVLAFVASGAIAGIAGALAAQLAGRVTPGVFSWHASLFVAVAALFGGTLSVAGPALAGYLIAALAQLTEVPAVVQLLAFAGVLLAAAVFDPRHVLTLSFGWNRTAAADRTLIARTSSARAPRRPAR